jgi:hypothetical protein
MIKRLNADVNLLFSIQKISAHSSAEILSYFNNIIINIVEDHFNKKPKKSLNKSMKWTYCDTNIPYKINVYSINSKREVYAEIKTVSRVRTINVDSFLDQDTEYRLGLEGSTPVANFSAPENSAPPIIKKILKNEEKNKPELSQLDISNLPKELREKFNL